MWKRSCLAIRMLCLALALLVLAGCNAKPTEEAEEGVCFTDDLGRQVTVPKAPQRVAALIGSFAELWVLAGGTVCAAPEDAWQDFDLPLEDAVCLGGAHSPNLELLIAADPDFVIASASTAADVDMMSSLESMGIPVAYFDVDCFEDYLNVLGICTDITGRKDLYAVNGTDVAERIEAVKAKLPDDKQKILLVRAYSGGVKAKGSEGTVLGEMLSDLGCVNIADSDGSLLENLSAESVIAQNPYRIFAVTMGSDTEGAKENLRRLITENPAYACLDAVKEGRVHIMDRRLFNIKPNARWAEAYEELAKILYE